MYTYLYSLNKMYTSILLVCGSHNLTTSESCITRCQNEMACCITSLGNSTLECLEFSGEGEITRCELGMFFC